MMTTCVCRKDFFFFENRVEESSNRKTVFLISVCSERPLSRHTEREKQQPSLFSLTHDFQNQV